MKTWFHRLFLAVIFTLTFAHVHVGVSVPNGLSSAQISVSVFQAAEANACVFVADGTSRNWSATTSWTGCGGVAPTAADDVTFSTNAVSSTLVIDGTSGSPSLCRSIDTTNYTRTITFAASKQLNIGDGTTGAFKMTAGMTFAPNATSVLKFVSTTTGNNITWGGYTYGTAVFDGVGGAWSFVDGPTFANVATSIITLTNGSLNTNGQSVLNPFLSSNNSNTRSLTLGASTWTFGNVGGATVWDITTTTGMTLSAASSTLSFTVASANQTFNSGGLTYGAITSTGISTGNITLNGAFAAATLTTSQAAGTGGSYQFGANPTISGTWTFNSNSVLNRVYITSTVKGTQRTVSAGAISSNGADLQDILGAGAATWNLSASTFGGGDCGGNSGITFNTPKTNWMKNAGANVNFSAANWFTADGGSTAITPAYPLPQDTNRVATAWTGASKTLTIDASAVRIGALDFTSAANTPGLVFTTAASYFGSITLVSGMTVSGTAGTITLEGRGSYNITTAGQALTPAMTLNAPGGTYTQQDAFTNSRSAGVAVGITAGTWACGANNFTLSGSVGGLSIQGGVMTGSGTLAVNGTGSPAIQITTAASDLNFSSGIITMTGAGSAMLLTAGSLEVGTLTRTGFALTIAGTTVQLGTGGAAFATPLTISSGSLAPTTGNKITSVSSTAIAVSAAASGGGSCSFGDAGQWRDWNEANDNVRYRRAM